MAAIDLLSSSLGKSDNEANIALARRIAEAEDKNAIKELVDNLQNKDKKIQSDCIKTLYETAYLKPALIADYCSVFFDLLSSKNNRLVWGAMIALVTITEIKHRLVFGSLSLITETVKKGSVITIDCGVEVYSKLNKRSEYRDVVEPLLIDELWRCQIKQLPQYIEKSLVSINRQNKEIYQDIINKRIIECERDAQSKRLNKALKLIDSK